MLKTESRVDNLLETNNATFCKEAVEAVKAASEEVDPVNLRVFIPAENVEH